MLADAVLLRGARRRSLSEAARILLHQTVIQLDRFAIFGAMQARTKEYQTQIFNEKVDQAR